MARFACSLSRCVILGCAALISAGAPAGADDGDVAADTLANGLRVYVVEKHSSPVASVAVWYRTGSLNERPGIRGLSHLFEHMMFRGSERFGPEEHHRRIAELGGTNNAYTREDVTVYHQTVPASAVDLVMEMEADRMARLRLDDSILRTEVEVVKEEYRLTLENDPMMRILKRIAQSYFGDHPYSYVVLGDMNDLDTVSVATCLAYYRERYAPNNAALIVAGDVNPDTVFAQAHERFGAFPTARIAPDPPPPAQPDHWSFSGKEDLPVPVTAVACRLPPAGDPDMPTIEILISMIGARLERRLTRESSLCIYVDHFEALYRQTSAVFFAGAHFANVPSTKVRNAIAREIDTFLAEPIPAEELDRIRNRKLLEEAMNRTRVGSMSQDVGNALFYGGDLHRYTERLEMLAALTPEGVSELGRRYFGRENRGDIFLGPKHSPFLIKVAGWVKTTFHI